jgi:hypothetical protein
MKRILLAAIAMLAFAFYSTASQAVVTSVTVTSVTLSQSTGAITVTGTIVCTAGDVFFAATDIIQVSGGHNGLTFGRAPATCTGGVDTWVAPQTLVFGSIKNGNADVIGEGFDVTDGSFTEQVFHQPVTPVP